MNLAEETRLYQATLTACRSSEDAGTDEDYMWEELAEAERTMTEAWYTHTVQKDDRVRFKSSNTVVEGRVVVAGPHTLRVLADDGRNWVVGRGDVYVPR